MAIEVIKVPLGIKILAGAWTRHESVTAEGGLNALFRPLAPAKPYRALTPGRVSRPLNSHTKHMSAWVGARTCVDQNRHSVWATI